MTDIQRYDNGYYDDWCHDGLTGCKKDPDGKVVKYDDHAAIVSALQQQVDALAAENSSLKDAFSPGELSTEVTDAFHDTAALVIEGDDSGSWLYVANEGEVIRAVLAALKPETPATDAIQTEWMAKGVDGFGCLIKNLNAVLHAENLKETLSVYAAELRTGDKS